MVSGSIGSRLGRASLLATLFAGVATAAFAAPHKPDSRDARIEQLEAEVKQLLVDHQRLAAQDQDLAAHTAELAAEVDALKRAEATDIQTIQTVAAKTTPPSPSVITTLAGARPVFTSANGRFTATIHALMQLDTGAYDQASAGSIATDLRRSGPALGASATNVDLTHARNLKDGVDFRRARLAVEGTAFGDWDYRFLLDFGGTGVENTGQVYETWVQYTGFNPLKLRVGAFSPSIGLEDQASTNGMPFIERTVSSDMARGLAAGDTRINAEAFAAGDHYLVAGAVSGRTVGTINTGTGTATPQTYGDQLGLVGRLAGTPLYGSDWMLHLGVHGSYVVRPPNSTGPGVSGATPVTAQVISLSNTPELRVDGTKLINTGNIDARHADTLGLEFALQKSSLMLQSEYERFGIDRADVGLSSPHFTGYYVLGTWVLTGEARKYNTQTAAFDAPPVDHPFSLRDGAWGAWEIGLRYSDINLNYHQGAANTAPGADAIRGGEEQNLTAGLNWYPNSLVRFILDYQHVRLERLSPNAALYQTPTGAQIGQSFDSIAVRSQFAF
jgi:phosphate-selective porin OprO/OprP